MLSKAIFRHRNSLVIDVIRRVLYYIYLLLINLSFEILHQDSAAPSSVPLHTQIAPSSGAGASDLLSIAPVRHRPELAG